MFTTDRHYAFVLSLLTALAWLPVQNAWGARSSLFADEWARTDFSQRTVDLNEIKSGGPSKNGIPAIDRPHFGRCSGF